MIDQWSQFPSFEMTLRAHELLSENGGKTPSILRRVSIIVQQKGVVHFSVKTA